MNIQNTKIRSGIFILVLVGLVAVFALVTNIQQLNPAEKQADKALRFLNNEDSTLIASSIFSSDFQLYLLSSYSYYKLDEWTLSSTKKSNEEYVVTVDGTATNALGVKLERQFDLYVEKGEYTWTVTDSYLLFDVDRDLPNITTTGMTDMEIDKFWIETKNSITLEDWEFYRSRYGSAKGEGTIVNNSEIPVDYIKISINYFDDNDDLVNSDWSYAIGSDTLQPGQKRNFSWTTSNCSNCTQATVVLVFE